MKNQLRRLIKDACGWVSMPKNAPSKQSAPFDLQNYVVLFLDVMGQKDAIFQFQLAPNDTPEVRQTVLETAGFIRELRDLANTVLQTDRDSEFMKSLSPDKRAELREATLSVARVSQTLSDALVISTPVGQDAHNFTTVANGIRWALVTSTWMQVRGLARQHPIRGGMDIGWGVLLDESEVYGATLASAYQLESQHADYPRVVCGSELIEFLKVIIGQEAESKQATIAAHAAKDSTRFLHRDDDGLFIVDFLGEAFHEGAHRVPGIGELVGRAIDFVRRECDRFTTHGPDRLAKRYQRLEKYVQSRRDIWR